MNHVTRQRNRKHEGRNSESHVNKRKIRQSERLIEEFAKRVIDQPNPRESFHWLTTRAHELGHSGSAEDLDQAISANYFALGFVFSWLAAKSLRPNEDVKIFQQDLAAKGKKNRKKIGTMPNQSS